MGLIPKEFTKYIMYGFAMAIGAALWALVGSNIFSFVTGFFRKAA